MSVLFPYICMINEIFISNSKLKVVKVTDTNREDLKKIAVYKTAYMLTGARGVSAWAIPWIVVKSDEKFGDIKYNESELIILSELCRESYLIGKTALAELIVRAIGDKKIINSFYSDLRFITTIGSFIQNPKVEKPDFIQAAIYQKSRYSIHQLLKDLVEDKSQVLIDPELIGHYKRMSCSVTVTQEYKEQFEKWCDLCDIVGNKTRANLSISISSKVSVKIPENELGITPEERTLDYRRNMCIVRDGLIWTRYIAVKVNNKRFINRLYSSGCVIGTVIYNNELLLDLSKIPVISKSKLKGINSISLCEAEVNVLKCDAAIKYLTQLQKQTEKPKEEIKLSPEIIYLHKLGIYDDKFFPSTITAPTTDSYSFVELRSVTSEWPPYVAREVSNLVNNKFKNIRHYPYFYNFISNIDIKSKPIDELIRDWKTKEYNCIKHLRDIKFRLILKKNRYRFDEYRQPSATQKTYYVKDTKGNALHIGFSSLIKSINIYNPYIYV